MSLFSSESKTETSTKVSSTDNRIAATDQAAVNHIYFAKNSSLQGNVVVENLNADLAQETVSSNTALAQAALNNAANSIDTIKESTYNTLTASTDFISEAFSKLLNVTDNRLAKADENIKASYDFAGNIISKEQETADDRLIKVIVIFAVVGIAAALINGGVFK